MAKFRNETMYHDETPDEVIKALETARHNGHRVRLFYGDTKTGKDWHEENDVVGYSGRSAGQNKIPLIIHNSRSLGGPAILDHCIVKIIVKGQSYPFVAYEHPKYQAGNYEIKALELPVIGYKVYIDGQEWATFTTLTKAERWVKFMKGERMAK